MILAELQVFHSRSIAPTRRVSVGRYWLPMSEHPFGAMLLAGVVFSGLHWSGQLDDDLYLEVLEFTEELEGREPLSQPRLRYRLQDDQEGLDQSVHRLTLIDGQVGFEIDRHGRGEPQLLAALYALQAQTWFDAGMRVVRKAMSFGGELDQTFFDWVLGSGAQLTRAALRRDRGWALGVFGFDALTFPTADVVAGRFRELVRLAHPDHGGDPVQAGARIVELTEAKKVLSRSLVTL